MIRKSIFAHLFVWIGMIFSIGSSFAQSAQFQPCKPGKSLPVAAAKYMTLQYRPATEQELEDFQKPNLGLEDYVGKFYNNLPFEKMGMLIEKNKI
jgi:hypothetical protein